MTDWQRDVYMLLCTIGRTKEAEQYRDGCGRICGECDVAICIDDECDSIIPQNKLLPGFAEVKTLIEEKGYKTDWIMQTVDPSEPGAIFIPNGKMTYKSDCPNYKGYWLCGHVGSVVCAACVKLLPGFQRELMCSRDYTKCVFYKTEAGEPL